MGIVRLLREPSSPGFERETTPADTVLVGAAREGHVWAQEALFRRHVRMAASLGHRLLASRGADLDELVQHSFGQALERLQRLRVPEAFASWLTSVVVRAAVRRLRWRALRCRLGYQLDPSAAFDALVPPSAPEEVRAALEDLYGGLNRLPAQQRVAWILRRVEGMSVGQVADALGVKLGAAKRKLWQAEERLTSFAHKSDLASPGSLGSDCKQLLQPELSEARVARLWSGVSRAMQHQQERRRRSLPRAVVVLVPLCAVGLMAVLYFHSFRPAPKPPDNVQAALLATQGDRVAMTLQDGSLLEMAPRSRVKLEGVSQEEVQLSLSQGRLTCDIVSEQSPRFTVQAGSTTVRGIGARFSVKHLAGPEMSRVEVRVERGRAEVSRRGSHSPPRHLAAGESWVVEERPGEKALAQALRQSEWQELEELQRSR